MTTERYQKGIQVMESIDGSSRKDKLKDLDEFCPDFSQMIVEFAFADIYSRPKLDLKTRELVTISSLITQQQLHHLKDHIKAARIQGATEDEIKEVIMQLAVYCGFPIAINAMMIAKEVFSEESPSGKRV